METNNNSINSFPEGSLPPRRSNISKWVLLIVIALIIAVAAYWFFVYKKPVNQNAPNPSNTNTSTDTNSQHPSTMQPLVSGLINWITPAKVNSSDILTDQFINNPNLLDQSQFYKIGTFQSGDYSGKDLMLLIAPLCNDGPCGYGAIRYINGVLDGSRFKYTILQKYSDPLDNFDDVINKNTAAVDNLFDIPDLNYPKAIQDSNKILEIADFPIMTAGYVKFDQTNLKFVYNDSKVGAVYTTSINNSSESGSLFDQNGFYVKAPDGGTIVYSTAPDFVPTNGIPKVTWLDGSSNKDQYNYIDIGGCGTKDYASVVSVNTVNPSKDLKKTGTTSTGSTVYELVDTNSKLLKDMYNNDYNPYTTDGQPSQKMPYDQFVTKHPLFFWTDSWDRLIQFKNTKFIISQAECGKPVIYLYPTQTEKVNVQLKPTGGFTYTKPAYLNGWNVTATPSGQLTNNSDGKTYPYLFWEGRSNSIYQIPDRGFVVAQKDLHSFLDDKLAELGLNAQETKDFEEYWEPYMQNKPYYFVTFMGNQLMNQIAPLTVTPKPDTVIRILMDFKGLDKPINVQGYDIKTPKRKGFTVVEWGGVKPY